MSALPEVAPPVPIAHGVPADARSTNQAIDTADTDFRHRPVDARLKQGRKAGRRRSFGAAACVRVLDGTHRAPASERVEYAPLMVGIQGARPERIDARLRVQRAGPDVGGTPGRPRTTGAFQPIARLHRAPLRRLRVSATPSGRVKADPRIVVLRGRRLPMSGQASIVSWLSRPTDDAKANVRLSLVQGDGAAERALARGRFGFRGLGHVRVVNVHA
jgi:hypothetical protein